MKWKVRNHAIPRLLIRFKSKALTTLDTLEAEQFFKFETEYRKKN